MVERPVVMLQDGDKTFGGVVALDKVSLTVMPGTFIALIGPNGCGKTTLFNVVSGYLELDRGSHWVNGRLISHVQPTQLARAGVGRTFQEGRVWQEMSVLDNIVIGARWAKSNFPFSMRRATRNERNVAIQLMEEVGLARALIEHPVGVLPLIERRRVELARALALNPVLLLVDEIAAGLNPVESESAFQLLVSIRRRRPQLATIAIEHKLDLLINVSDRVVFMSEGSIALDTSAAAIRGNPALLNQYWSPIRAKQAALQ